MKVTTRLSKVLKYLGPKQGTGRMWVLDVQAPILREQVSEEGLPRSLEFYTRDDYEWVRFYEWPVDSKKPTKKQIADVKVMLCRGMSIGSMHHAYHLKKLSTGTDRQAYEFVEDKEE